MDNLDQIVSKHLGKGNSYAIYTDRFDSSLLVAMPRELARKDWGITGKEFIGSDIWHCHEATFLTNNGLPVAGTLKIIYDSDSKYMIESKSMKLYLNTFDMCKMGECIAQAQSHYEQQIRKDLERSLQTPVSVRFFDSKETIIMDPAYGFINLFEMPNSTLDSFIFDDYTAQKNHLSFISLENKKEVQTLRIKTNILRSRCRHTKQKDTGEAVIHLKTKGVSVNIDSIFKTIVSLREVNEFHEFCAEKLFVDFTSHKEVTECMIMLLYSRRGSLDINPIRTTSYSLVPGVMQNVDILTQKQLGQ